MRIPYGFKFIYLLALFMLLPINLVAADNSISKLFVDLQKDGATYVGTETCMACHDEDHKDFTLSTHSRVTFEVDDGDIVEAQGCEMCHGPGSIHADEGEFKNNNIYNPKKDPALCFQCHIDKKAEFRLPYSHPVLEGKMSCSDCHNSHGSDARPGTTTSLDGGNGTCFQCHKEQRGPFVFEHEAVREGCTTCHKVHGAINDKMLVVRDNNLCLRCHTQSDFPSIGDSNHSSRLTKGTCFSGGCHTAVHGSNFDDHLRY